MSLQLDCAAADSGSVLATLNLPSDWMATASNVVLDAITFQGDAELDLVGYADNTLPPLTIVAAGTAGAAPVATARRHRGTVLDPFFQQRLNVSVDGKLAARGKDEL